MASLSTCLNKCYACVLINAFHLKKFWNITSWSWAMKMKMKMKKNMNNDLNSHKGHNSVPKKHNERQRRYSVEQQTINVLITKAKKYK